MTYPPSAAGSPGASRSTSPDSGDDAVRVDGVTRSFGAVLAVDNVSLSVGYGETIALLGPNGAGKTTTISMLLGLSTPDSGRIEIFGSAP